MKKPCQTNNEYANLIISDLVNLGVSHFCIGSGSRSAPLAEALENNTRATTVVHYDERSLGFYALGLAKGLNSPVCIITTSGSATVNLFPAVMEAYMDHIPLVVITCDRPFEDLDRGTNQTCDQEAIFGNYVDCSKTIPAPPHTFDSAMITSLLSYLIHRVKTTNTPIHINIPFKEPLITEAGSNLLAHSITNHLATDSLLCEESLDYIIDLFSSFDKGIIIAGGNCDKGAANDILILGEKLGYPILADPLSGIRELGGSSMIISHYNQILHHVGELSQFKPDVVIFLGGHIISKNVLLWTKTLTSSHQIIVSDCKRNIDPTLSINTRICMKPSHFAKMINSKINHKPACPYPSLWQSYSLTLNHLIPDFFEQEDTLYEPVVITSLLPLLNKAPFPIFLGNSLSIRYGDNFLFPSSITKRIYGNRGVSGIDGNISTAIGICDALNTPLIAVIGDCTFLHDVGALHLMSKQKTPLILIVINNNGGGIFDFLPYADNKRLLENKISPASNVNVGNIAAAFNIAFWKAGNSSDYQKMIEHLLEEKSGGIIEVNTSREENVLIHKKLKAYIEKNIEKNLKKERGSYFFMPIKKTQKTKSFAFMDS